MTIVLGLFGGLALLVVAGDLLVRGAVDLSLRLGLPALLVSLTIVAFGTSAPELVISVQAALEGAPAIAIGNVVGSNIANVLLVLGLPALAAGLGATRSDCRASYLMMMAATLLAGALAADGWIGRGGGLVLLAGLAAMIAHTILQAGRSATVAQAPVRGVAPPLIALYLLAGLVGLPLGAHFFIDAAVKIARLYAISEEVIGLTLVAVGTSLPELATTVMAAVRRNADVVLGNVIGSNLFNLLGILGVTAVIVPLPVPPQMLQFDGWVMLGASLLLAPVVFFNLRLARWAGAGLTALYAAYVLALLA